MSYSHFNSISFAQLFQTNEYSTMFTVISKINCGKILKERMNNILVSKVLSFTVSGIIGVNKCEAFHRDLLQKMHDRIFVSS